MFCKSLCKFIWAVGLSIVFTFGWIEASNLPVSGASFPFPSRQDLRGEWVARLYSLEIAVQLEKLKLELSFFEEGLALFSESDLFVAALDRISFFEHLRFSVATKKLYLLGEVIPGLKRSGCSILKLDFDGVLKKVSSEKDLVEIKYRARKISEKIKAVYEKQKEGAAKLDQQAFLQAEDEFLQFFESLRKNWEAVMCAKFKTSSSFDSMLKRHGVFEDGAIVYNLRSRFGSHALNSLFAQKSYTCSFVPVFLGSLLSKLFEFVEKNRAEKEKLEKRLEVNKGKVDRNQKLTEKQVLELGEQIKDCDSNMFFGVKNILDLLNDRSFEKVSDPSCDVAGVVSALRNNLGSSVGMSDSFWRQSADVRTATWSRFCRCMRLSNWRDLSIVAAAAGFLFFVKKSVVEKSVACGGTERSL